jgi:hypothetical protein
MVYKCRSVSLNSNSRDNVRRYARRVMKKIYLCISRSTAALRRFYLQLQAIPGSFQSFRSVWSSQFIEGNTDSASYKRIAVNLSSICERDALISSWRNVKVHHPPVPNWPYPHLTLKKQINPSIQASNSGTGISTG